MEKRKFKHKSTGEIAINHSYVDDKNYKSDRFGFIAKELIENSNDWEEIKDEVKDYEILSYYCSYFKPSTKEAFDKQNEVKDYEILSFGNVVAGEFIKGLDGKFHHSITCIKDEEWLLKSKNQFIKSVKRLSDGEVFTIGDQVQDSLTDQLTNYKVQTINYFNKGNKIICNAESGTTMPLNTIRKAKKSIFTSEDGVKIFEGDTFYHVDPYFVKGSGRASNKFEKLKGYKEFSTKQKAEEYIKWNKPMYSMIEINNAFDADSLYLQDIKRVMLKRLEQGKTCF